MSRLIFHIDVNSAFLSWESARRVSQGLPDLREIPSCVGGDPKKRTGIVVAKSIPAKKYGIQTGEPVAMALRKCPNLVIVPSDFELYDKCSRAFKAICASFAPVMESFSIDEVFLDMTGTSLIYPDPVAAAHELKDKIHRELGFTVNVGISTNKLLAKMASDFEKPNKVHTLFPEEIPAKMWPLPVRELLFLGKASEKKLTEAGIRTIGDLAQMNPELLEIHLKSHGRKLWEFANGMDNSPVEPVRQEAKGIGNSITLPQDAKTEEEACEVLGKLAGSVGRRLRKAGQKAGMISVEIKYYNFENSSHQTQLERATNEDARIYETAAELFREMWKKQPIRLLGIRSSKLTDASAPEQLTIFEVQPEMEKRKKASEKKAKLEQALKEIRGRYGEEAVIRGSNMEEKREKEK